jgi:hypothetical protein
LDTLSEFDYVEEYYLNEENRLLKMGFDSFNDEDLVIDDDETEFATGSMRILRMRSHSN